MATFMGSGSAYLNMTFAPTNDRYDCASESEDELRMSTDSFGSGVQTLGEVGYTIAPYGSFILNEKKEKVDAVFKKTKLPKGTAAPQVGPNECAICMMDMEPEELVETDCHHKYCRECMSYYLHLQTGDIQKLGHTISYLEKTPGVEGVSLRISHVCGVECPHPTCHAIIDGGSISRMADPGTWERFDHLALMVLLNKYQITGQAVACPLKCGGIMQDCICSTESCRVRTATLAEKERIRLHKLWRLAEARGMELLRKWAAGLARQCPKCEYLIEKNGGCDHMFCIQCRTHFSWASTKAHF